MKLKVTVLVSVFTLSGLIVSCARAPIQRAEEALTLVAAPTLADDLPRSGLAAAIERQLQFFKASPAERRFQFGNVFYTHSEYIEFLELFLKQASLPMTDAEFYSWVASESQFYQVYGRDRRGEALITSYFEPLIDGVRRPDARFSQPLYSVPDDLLLLNLEKFDPKYEKDRKLRARLVDRRLLPYYTREEIDSKGALKGRKLEIVWVDPIDAFFLQVQGSGVVRLPDGTVKQINYSEKNGQPYESIGKFLRDQIPIEQINLGTIENYLRGLGPEELQTFLNRNPSYVFFREGGESAVTFLGVSASDGRTIATDPAFFSKGALAFLIFDRPVFDDDQALVPARTERVSRFVLDQDIGGAITGPGRADLFWGRGKTAGRMAGAVKSTGRLYYLGPRVR